MMTLKSKNLMTRLIRFYGVERSKAVENFEGVLSPVKRIPGHKSLLGLGRDSSRIRTAQAILGRQSTPTGTGMKQT